MGDAVRLDGPWRASTVDESLRRSFTDPAFDDRHWASIRVPGHWRSEPAFADEDTGLLYRTAFAARPPEPGSRSWLTLEGVFYESDVWLDGSYVGDTEGYFFPHTFEITEALGRQDEHVLAVDVACPRPADLTAKRAITGVFQHWDCLDPEWNPGGIWRPVAIHHTGPVRISRLRVLCIEATPERARLSVRAVLDAAQAMTVRLTTTVAGADHVSEQPLAAGENRVQWNIAVESPRLWWPHALGDQPLEELTVVVAETDGDEAVSDRRSVTTGFRQIRMAQWVLTVNGERLFLKGANLGPTRMALAEATAAELERDVALARATGLDLLRIHAHITRPELYDAADRHGLLLWQDLPLQWGYARGIRKQAARQAREAVDLLGQHPSIAVWCGHNEPLAIDIEPGREEPAHGRGPARAGRQQLPTWNRTLLDPTVRRALERADASRPVVAHSGVVPHAGSGGTDSHLYYGWHHGDRRDLARLLGRFPRLARFVSEFGAQAVPHTAGFMNEAAWPDLDWERLGRRHGMQKAPFDRYVPPADYATFEAWQQATQAYQAEVIRHHVETLRRLKYRPTGGFAQFLFADGHPGVTWSVLDHDRVPKAAHEALAAACAPIIVVADPLEARYRPGDALALDVHVVSDLRTALHGAIVRARLRWPDGDHQWGWEGDVPADDCVRIGTLQALAPDTTGVLVLELELECEGVKAGNRYDAEIVP